MGTRVGPLGARVGAWLGRNGAAEGARLGLKVLYAAPVTGFRVGLMVGVNDGLTDGANVGSADGSTVSHERFWSKSV